MIVGGGKVALRKGGLLVIVACSIDSDRFIVLMITFVDVVRVTPYSCGFCVCEIVFMVISFLVMSLGNTITDLITFLSNAVRVIQRFGRHPEVMSH
jgi:hypothetical protein